MKLLDQVRDVMRRRHYSIRTEQAYVEWIKRFILFHGKRHPKDMGEKEITQYLSYPPTHRNVAAIIKNHTLYAIGRLGGEESLEYALGWGFRGYGSRVVGLNGSSFLSRVEKEWEET